MLNMLNITKYILLLKRSDPGAEMTSVSTASRASHSTEREREIEIERERER